MGKIRWEKESRGRAASCDGWECDGKQGARVDIRESMLLALLCTVDRKLSPVHAVKRRGAEELAGPSAGAASPYRDSPLLCSGYLFELILVIHANKSNGINHIS
jgi:hypothetical protein